MKEEDFIAIFVEKALEAKLSLQNTRKGTMLLYSEPGAWELEGSWGWEQPPIFGKGTGIWSSPQYLALIMQNGAQITGAKPMFCSKTDSFPRLCPPPDPHKSTN